MRRGGRLATLTLGTVATSVAALTGLTPAAASPSPFVPGTGNASAEIFSLPLVLAGEDIGVNQGLSVADFANQEGEAEAQTLPFGLSVATVPEPDSILGIQATSTSTPQDQTASVVGTSGAGLGTEEVDAAQSAATAATDLLGFSASSLIDVVAPQSWASSSIVNGNTRQAEATVHIGSVSLLGGLVVLSGLQWTSTQRSGGVSTESSDFSMASVTIAGHTTALTPSSLDTAVARVNTVLAPSGLKLSLPSASVASDGVVQESPLSIGVYDSPLGQQALRPVTEAIQPVRTAIFDDLAKLNSTAGGTDLYVEVVLGILAGQGDVDLNLGGTYATTNGTTYTNPLTSTQASALAAPALGAPIATSPGTSGLEPSTATALPAAPALVPSLSPATTPASTGQPGPGTPVAAAPRAVTLRSTSCRSTVQGGCRPSDGVPVAVGVLVASMGLMAFELVRHQRRKRALAAEH